MSVLVSCGGTADRDALAAAGFTDVTITNVDSAGDDGALAPFAWEHQDAEALTYEDESFDVAIVSAGLHHCRSPHRALLELYRVARVAVVALESRDSTLMRLGVRLGAVDEYELGAVAAHGLRAGGVENTSTPNYVYRWTEREVEKTVASFAPHARHRIRFFREFELPEVLVSTARGPAPALLAARAPARRRASRAPCRARQTCSRSRSRSPIPRATCSPGWRRPTSRTSARSASATRSSGRPPRAGGPSPPR